MSTGIIGSVILWGIAAIIVIAIVVYLLNWLYYRSTKEVAFVRTGFGGESVIINGGALVLPIIHEVTSVNLNVLRIPVLREKEHAVITKDRMRVDIEAEFFVRVIQEKEAVAAAASTLGRRTMENEQLAELLSGKFVGALRSVAAEMSLDDMHEKRNEYVSKVTKQAAQALEQNGLELESVAITDLDQTDLEHFNPANQFDAEGLTRLIETIEDRRKHRNDIEQTSMVAIRSRNLKAEKETLLLEQESENARLAQEKEIESLKARQRADVEKERTEKEAETEKTRIQAEQETRSHEISRQKTLQAAEIKAQIEIEQAKIEQESLIRDKQIRQKHDIETAEIAAIEDVERAKVVSEQQLRLAKITAEEEADNRDIQRNKSLETSKVEANKNIEVARISVEQALDKARIDRDRKLRAEQISMRQVVEENEISAQEEIERARIASERGLDEARIIKERDVKRLEIEREHAVELANIDSQIAVLQKQSEEAQTRVSSEAARAAAVEAEEKVATTRETAIAQRIAAIDKLVAEKDADTARISAEAEKVSAAVAAEAQRLLNEAENVLSEDARAVKLRSKLIDRLEGIVRESVKPMENIEGIKILHVDGLTGGSGEGSRSPTDEVIESALRYRAQAPLIDEMMKEIGIQDAGVAKMGDIFRSAKDVQSLSKDLPPKKKDS